MNMCTCIVYAICKSLRMARCPTFSGFFVGSGGHSRDEKVGTGELAKLCISTKLFGVGHTLLLSRQKYNVNDIKCLLGPVSVLWRF